MKQLARLKVITLTIILMLTGFVSIAAPPDPPPGKVWLLNAEMSDEFSANGPDTEKWRIFDKADSWPRTAAFDKRIHEMEKDPASDNHFLTMNPMWYYEDERFTSAGGRTYYFAGGGMETNALATYGYYEVHLKPSNFPMGSGVFMHSRQPSSDDCDTKYHSELDIMEGFGYNGPGASDWNGKQHVNSHAKPYSSASGSCQQAPTESANNGLWGYPMEEPLEFNTVGMWWKDEQTALFYNNNNYYGTVTPRRDFNLPMTIIIVTETYTWGDDDENNAGNPKPEEYMFEDDFRTKEERAVVYDWVRVWNLIDISENEFNDTTDNISGYQDSITIYPTNTFSPSLIYSARAERTVRISVFDPSDLLLSDTSYMVNQGTGTITTTFTFLSELQVADNYKVVYHLKNGDEILETDTSIVNVITKPLEKKLWGDKIPTSLPPTTTGYDIEVDYETDTNSVINIEIRSPEGAWIGGGNKSVSAGNGTVTIAVNVTTDYGTNYFYKVYMHRAGYDWRDPLNHAISPNIYFNVEDPLVPSISILGISDPIYNTDSSLDVEFHYASEENGSLEIVLLNSENRVVAEEYRKERLGDRTLTRTMDIDSVLTPANDYKIAITYSPEGESSNLLTDTLFSVEVLGTSLGNHFVQSGNSEHIPTYPNPTDGIVNVILPENAGGVQQLTVRDISGNALDIEDGFQMNKQGINFDLGVCPPGLYIVHIRTTNNHYYCKVLKQ